MLKHYVRFYSCGSLLDESTTSEIDSREAAVELPQSAFGYSFFDREEVEKDGEILKGSVKNESPMHYYGEVLTLEQVKSQYPGKDNEILIFNMECNGRDRAIRTIKGN